MNSGGDFAILNYINIYNWPDFSKIKEKKLILSLETGSRQAETCTMFVKQ